MNPSSNKALNPTLDSHVAPLPRPAYHSRNKVKESAQYLKIVEWSEKDRCYVGRCPELMFGGVHGKNEPKVFAELCAVIDEWVTLASDDGDTLPPGMAGKKYSGKFNLRLGKELHERLAIEAVKEGKSLNAFCAEALKNGINR